MLVGVLKATSSYICLTNLRWLRVRVVVGRLKDVPYSVACPACKLKVLLIALVCACLHMLVQIVLMVQDGRVHDLLHGARSSYLVRHLMK